MKSRNFRILSRHIVVLTAAVVCFAPAIRESAAADLVVALREVATSVDPHFMSQPVAFQLNSQIFEPLIRRDDSAKPEPSLATSWEIVNETTWLFRLRKDVKWSDGSPFTAEDVAFTYDRANNVPNAPSSFRPYLNDIKEAQVVDPYTLRIITNTPAPALLEKLAQVLIVSKKNGQGATTADYNSSKAVIGTGPYKLDSWVPNDNAVIVRNSSHWGPKPEWDKVTYKVISNDSSRVAALLAGDVDVIETVPAQDIGRLEKTPSVKVWNRLVPRVAYISMDLEKAHTLKKVTGLNGEALDKNPLADQRVRQALALSIDTTAIARSIYDGQAEPTNQFLPDEIIGYDDKMPKPAMDLTKARKLLDESGWAGKFKMTLSVASPFFPKDSEAAQAIAQSWTRLGIPTSVDKMPYAVFLKMRNAREHGILLSNFQNSSASADSLFTNILHTKDDAKALGVLNNLYSNTKVDALIDTALSTMDVPKRSDLMKQAVRIVHEESAIFPVWFFINSAASKAGLKVGMRSDAAILARNVTSVKP